MNDRCGATARRGASRRAHLEPTGTTATAGPSGSSAATSRCSPTAAPIRTCAPSSSPVAGTTFCPGADTDELQVYTDTHEFNPEMHAIEQPDYYPLLVDKPMIAAINGACAGIGLVQAMMCDVRIAAQGLA